MSTRISLAQQIALLSEAAPADFDPEDLHPPGPHSEDEAHEDGAAAREHYVDVGPSSLRQLNHSINDPKYQGTRVSRKDLDASDDEEYASGTDGSEDEDADAQGAESEQESASSDEHHDEAPRSSPHPAEHASQTRQEESQQEQPNTSDLASTLRATREQDREKGKAVARQITVWDTLLDARIRLQKASTAVNHLASLSIPSSSRQEEPIHASLNAMLDEAIALSQDLFELQEGLSHVDASPPYPPRKRAKLSHDSERDYSETLSSLSATASEFEASYHPHLIQVLAKWSAKVQAVAPNVLLPANRSSFKNAFAGKTSPPGVVDVIAETLRSDSEKLLARTRSARLADDDDAADRASEQVFDDTDFYQQLLRDIIEARGSGLNGEGAEPEWMRRQRANKAKRKKTVDVKASKGRKLRYQVHEKLQNFMVPIAAVKGAWHEEQIDELFASLLGGSKD